MREILYRGKRVDTGEWVEGYIVKSNGNINHGQCYILPAFADFSYGDNGNRIRIGCFVEVDPETVCEFTGLTDKNGKKIFENDIIKHGDQLRDVFFNGETLTWEMRLLGTKPCEVNHLINTIELAYVSAEMAFGDSCSTEVIGSVYDHPELLGEDKK